ncbi:M56 family metallopeptidase [Cognatishimia sp. SS12]|uniref:M56 family metallopeptidase n=1 Tax=Cognatishimia sp. SS12 TaxID=2979465 RepID=UPI00232A7C5C|nr:M56 family metallopeptidase [Cognatishimia sp. SS12]MDC0738666.1 M56 family metallopeptidase [Cognatishimia sp. SS12]
MTVDQIVGGAIWVQLMILLAALVFAVFEGLLLLSGNRRHYLTRRRLGVATIACLGSLPFIMPYLSKTSYAASVNATDVIVAQVLKGNIGISAIEMNNLFQIKARVMEHLTTGRSVTAQLVIAVFLTALILRAAYILVNLWRVRRSIRQGWVIHRSRRMKLIMSPHITVPYSTRGLWFYYVVIPQSFSGDRRAMQMALGHEMQHIRQGDVDAEVLMSILSPLVVLNPGFWFLSSRLRKLGELACDRAYLARSGFDAHGYSLRLLTLAKQNLSNPAQPTALGVPLAGRNILFKGHRSILKERILAIAHDQEDPKRETIWFAFALSLMMAVGVLFGAAALAEPPEWSHDRIMLSTVANLDRLNELNTLAQRSW